MEKGTQTKVFTVSALNASIKRMLEAGFCSIWVEGEVSNYYFHHRRHMYFDLKDAHTKIKVAMFYQNNRNLMFEINDGLHILVNGYVSLYEKRGEYQVIATDIKPVGKGSLILAFEQLKEKLEKNGYFKQENKKKLPVLPKIIGLATSTGGAVLRDIISVLNRRSDRFHLVVRNVNVQGPACGEDVCQAIDDLVQYGVDVIILARGGGSLEDLWGFNTEMVAEKIFQCPLPIISAVGHETDFTISDFVADVRAATPSVGAELAILDKTQALEQVHTHIRKLRNLIAAKTRVCRREVGFLLDRKIFKQPQSIIIPSLQAFDDASVKMNQRISELLRLKQEKLRSPAHLLVKGDLLGQIKSRGLVTGSLTSQLLFLIKKIVSSKKSRAEVLLKGLQASSPAAILGKGFGVVYKEKKDLPLKSIRDVQIGENIRVLLKDGTLYSKIIHKLQKKWSTTDG